MKRIHASLILFLLLGIIVSLSANRIVKDSALKLPDSKATVTIQDLSGGITPSNLVQTILGGGVASSNIVYTGSNFAAGTFSGGIGAGLSIGSGIVLSTGSAAAVVGPNESDATSNGFGLPGDADLTALINGTTLDACILEFDFIPQTANLQFTFVMGSEEYEEYIEYADVFAFYLNGVNIALLPGTSIPISIGTVNQLTNTSYYVNNYPSPGTYDIECDGFTIPISLNVTVNPGVSNHIKLAVADFTDDALDTWIFINGESFTSGYNVYVNSDPVGAHIFKDNVDTGLLTPSYIVQATGTTSVYRLEMTDYSFDPASITVPSITSEQSIFFTGTAGRVIIVDGETPAPSGVTIVGGGDIPSELLGPDTGYPAVVYTVEASGTWDVVVSKPVGWDVDWYCWIKADGVLYAGPNPIEALTPSYTFSDMFFGAKSPAVVIVNDSETLPVELSSFTAAQTAQNFVSLSWVSQSETNLLGYRVYRSDSNILQSSQVITPELIGATNTSTIHAYNFTDHEVELGHSYWYWLESVDYSSTQFHGPITIQVEADTPPMNPGRTMMRNVYPNPFTASNGTTIEVEVKENDNGNVTIYNLAGQKVISFPVVQGSNSINWNGKNSHGKTCSNGIYFCKLSTSSCNQTRKLLIVK